MLYEQVLASALRKIAAKPVNTSSSPLHAQGNHQLFGHMYESLVDASCH